MYKRITIKNLLQLGKTKKEISKTLGVHRNTIRNIEKEDPLKEKVERKEQTHILDEHKDYLVYKLDKIKLSYTRIQEDLQREKGITVHYDALRHYIQTRKLRGSGKSYIVLHSEPGEEMQVDFGYIGLQLDEHGKRKKAWIFVGTMSYSRKAFHKIVFNQTINEFIQCHIEAFEYFGGVPKKVKIDNLKAAVIEAHFYDPLYQKDFYNFSQHYGFIIHDCKVRRPEEKGKVENGVKYIKNNLFKGRVFDSQNECAEVLSDWQENKCNKRIHGTTQRIPAEVFTEEEKEYLKPLPQKRWEVCSWERRKVSTTSHIIIEKNYYSVPSKYNKEYVDVKISQKQIAIYKEGKQIALHVKLQGTGKYQTNVHHYPSYKRYDTEEYKKNQEQQIQAMGSHAGSYLNFLKEKGSTNFTRDTLGLMHLQKIYGSEVVDLACKRALLFKASGHKIIENICKKKLYTDFSDVPVSEVICDNNEINANPPEWKLERPLSYYAQIICNLIIVLWSLFLHLDS